MSFDFKPHIFFLFLKQYLKIFNTLCRSRGYAYQGMCMWKAEDKLVGMSSFLLPWVEFKFSGLLVDAFLYPLSHLAG